MCGHGVRDNALDDRSDSNSNQLADKHTDQSAEDHHFPGVVGGNARDDGDGKGAKPAASPDDFGEYSGRHRKSSQQRFGPRLGREVGATAHGLEAAPSPSAGRRMNFSSRLHDS